ncbi:MAG: sensor histidine kinase [Planctomycetota bacterium]|jgi:heavy metal sensor kinase
MRPLSLKWRIGICTAILLFVVIAAMSVVAYIELNKSLVRGLDNTLLADVETIIALIESEDSLQEVRKEIDAFLNPKTVSGSSMYRIWFENEDEYFAASQTSQEWLSSLISKFAKVPSAGDHDFASADKGADHYRLVWARSPDPRQDPLVRHTVNIVIAVNSRHVISEMAEFLEVLLIFGIITVLGALGLVSWILHWGLKPVADLTVQMNEISAKTLERQSPDVPNSPAELRPFVLAWDRMLERLALAMQQQRRFTADASHELRTPLTVAKSTLQTTLSQERSSGAYRTAMEQSLEDLAKLQHLIEQLLELAHLDDITDQSQWETIDVGDLVADVCERLVPVAEQGKGTLKWQVCPARTSGSDEQLRQLFANLIDNAIKYGPPGGEVLVSMRCLDGFINVSVHDDGGGIPQEEQKNIFDRFYRVRETRSQTAAGAGLGLALAQEIAHRHRGSITVYSDPGRGTDFVVTLPQT